jgi:hypothetical protein
MANTQSSTEILKVDTEGRVRTPKEKREEILSAYGGSGMTGRQFAEYAGVKYSTLMNWLGKSRRARPAGQEICKTPGMNWVEAKVEEGGCGLGEVVCVEIGSSVRMLVGSPRQAALAGEVIRSLGVMRPC